jgi:hypothetical protein
MIANLTRAIKALTAFPLITLALIMLAPLIAWWMAQECWKQGAWAWEVLP